MRRTRVYGPYFDKKRGDWRVVVDPDEGARTSQRCKSEEEAHQLIQQIEEEQKLEGPILVSAAMDDYLKWRGEQGVKPGSIKTARFRLDSLIGAEKGARMAQLGAARCEDRYRELVARVAADTHRNTLSLAKAMWEWAMKRGHVRHNPWEAVEPQGRRRKGKMQLRRDEARAFVAKALELAEGGDDGAVAALCCLLLGMRASEVVQRVGRDLDDGGALLWIDAAKTEAGKRVLDVPEVLRPLLGRLAKGPSVLLFPRSRYWLRDQVKRICGEAGVTVVCPHGLRGTHASLAIAAGASSALVASSLGHASAAVTLAHYAQPAAVAAGQSERALKVLAGGRK